MSYTLTNSTLPNNIQIVVRDVDGANIPPDPRNIDFQTYLTWLSSGNTPNPIPILPFQILQSQTIQEGINYCDLITQQIIPNQIYQTAYQNAAGILGASATIPTSDPLKTEFNTLASILGMTPQNFANVVINITASSFSLSSSLMVLEGTVAASNNTTQLANAISTFETSTKNLINTLNSSGLTITIVAPPSITIPGVNV